MEARVNIEFEKRKSNKTGNDYYVVVFEFPNGYRFEEYANNDRLYAIRTAIQQQSK